MVSGLTSPLASPNCKFNGFRPDSGDLLDRANLKASVGRPRLMPRAWVYPDRVARSDCDHRYPRLLAAPCFDPRKRRRSGGLVQEQLAPTRVGFRHLFPG